MRKWSIILIFIFLFSFVSADLITPGYSPISIENKIINLNDYPDYIFFSSGMDSIGPEMCPALPLAEGGIIQTAYKFCRYNVYATKKENKDKVEEIFKMESEGNFEEAYSKFKELEKIKVIEDVDSYKELPISDPNRFERNEYKIFIGGNPSVNSSHTSQKVKDYPGNLDYIYILISFISLIIITYIIIKEKRKK